MNFIGKGRSLDGQTRLAKSRSTVLSSREVMTHLGELVQQPQRQVLPRVQQQEPHRALVVVQTYDHPH